MIKAIETEYRGCLFRSRTEARWAVFFDAYGAVWDYEPEGFVLPGGRYLPDFRIHVRPGFTSQRSVLAEVKPDVSEDDWVQVFAKAIRFAVASRSPVLLLDGEPAARGYRLIVPATATDLFEDQIQGGPTYVATDRSWRVVDAWFSDWKDTKGGSPPHRLWVESMVDDPYRAKGADDFHPAEPGPIQAARGHRFFVGGP